LDFLNGGDLYQHMMRSNKFKENRARFYAAEIVLALDFLHKHNIVYRDLKPQNILLGIDGHVKLTDFGLSKNDFDANQENTICGTVKYIAPEAISGKKYDHMVDWWSLGIIIYRMLTGKLPYPTNKNNEVRVFIVKCKIKISRFKFSKPAYKLLTGLLQKDPNKRLGAWGIREILDQDFFKGIDWDELYDKKLDPPYLPKLKSNVDWKLISKEIMENSINSNSMDDTDVREGNMRGEYFPDFTYTRDTLFDTRDDYPDSFRSGRETMG